MQSAKLLAVITLLFGCMRREYRPAIKPPPCVVAPWPELQKVDAFLCGDDENQYICLTAQATANLAAYIEAVEAWHDSLKTCEQVTEAVLS